MKHGNNKIDRNKDKQRSVKIRKEKRSLLNSIESRYDMPIHTEELHSIILNGMIEGKHKRGNPRICYKKV